VFRRALYSLILVVGLLVVWINGRTYLHDVRLGMAMTSAGLLQLAYVLVCCAIPLIALRTLLQLRHRNKTKVAAARSLRDEFHRIQAVSGGAFASRPISASLISLLLISIPFVLVLLASGGWGSLGPHDWVMVGVAELPIAFVVLIGLFSLRSNRRV
jgi:hypothetical protein